MPDNLRIPPLSGLMAFEAVARHSSFSRAADELSITQSAVSHRIRQLESLLGVSLLLRIGHNVTMTSKGKELLPFVREGISHLKDGIAKLSVSGKPRLKLSLAPAVASNWLIQRLTEFQRIHPANSMDIIVTSKMVNIRSGEADIGIRFGTGEWEGLEAIKLMPVNIIAVCSPAYKRAHPWLKCRLIWLMPPCSDKQSLPGARGLLLRESIFPSRIRVQHSAKSHSLLTLPNSPRA